MNNQNRPNSTRPLEEPAYRISPNSDNFASSFGSGGMISQVVDPEFRTPTTFPTASLSHIIHDHAMNASNNIYSQQLTSQPSGFSPYLNDVSLIPLPDDNNSTSNNPPSSGQSTNSFQSHDTNQLADATNLPAFSMSSTATTFSDIAKQASNNNSSMFSTNITQSTLNEYGPPNAGNIDYFNPPQDKQQGVGTTSSESSGFSSVVATSSTSSTRNDTQVKHTIIHTNNIISSFPKEPPVYNKVSTSAEPSSTFDAPLYSPPPATSPPLDKVDPPTASTSTAQDVLRSSSNASKVPKKAPQVDAYSNMGLIELQARYRQCENELKINNKRRFEIERILNNMTRQAHGKNIEMDPYFRQNKDDQRQCDIVGREINERMKKIAEKLLTKFDFRIHKDCNPGSSQKRAKMSTAAVTPVSKPKYDITENRPPKKEERLNNLMLYLTDKKTWCKSCEEHFETLNDFCDHLHHKDHMKLCPKTRATPWLVSKDPVDQRKTYDLIKSICGKVSNEIGTDFSPINLDRVLRSDVPEKEKDKLIKKNNLERERGNLSKDDPLFEVKGYDFLMPINGFFCKLCQKALCDNLEVEQHLKSYEHNFKHVKTIALQPKTEQAFRNAMEKSRHEHAPPELPKEKTKSPKKHASTSGPKYKKITSHIVDEHEVAADKFKRKINMPSTSSAAKTSIDGSRKRLEDDNDKSETNVVRRILNESSDSDVDLEPKSKSQTFKRGIPDIVPINESRNQPAALKRLKQAQSKTTKEASTIETTEPTSLVAEVVEVDEIETEYDQQPIKKRIPEKAKEKDERQKKDKGKVSARFQLDSSSDTNADEPTKDDSPMYNAHVDQWDPKSPFPELNLCVTGNINYNVLYDARLAQPCKVVMKRESLENYKDMLLDETTLWTRVRALMAKKEPEHLRNELERETLTEPTYFSVTGQTIPVDVEKEPVEKSGKEQKNGKDKDSSSSGSPEPRGNLAFLERFFCN